MRYKGDKGKAWEAVKAWSRRSFKDCYTCGAKDIVSKNAQAGHYRPVAIVGSNNRKAWDERFIRLQCSRCNGAGQGEQVAYRARLVKDLGEEAVYAYDRAVIAKTVDPIKDWRAVRLRFEAL